MVDIEINARFSLFLISRLTQSCVCILKSVNINNQSDLSEAGKLKIETTETDGREELSNFEKPVFDLPVLLVSYQ